MRHTQTTRTRNGVKTGPQGTPKKPRPLTPDQLQHLIGRAERGRLLPAEADLLRTAVVDLLASVQALSSANRLMLVAGLVEVRRLREQLNAALLELGVMGPLTVACSLCGAEVGQLCCSIQSAVAAKQPHAVRLRAAGLAAVAA